MIKVIVIQKLKMSSWKETYEDDDDDENGDVEEKIIIKQSLWICLSSQTFSIFFHCR